MCAFFAHLCLLCVRRCGRRHCARLRWCGALRGPVQDEALFQFPMLKADGLKGAVVYYDAQQNDSRMNVLLVLTGTDQLSFATEGGGPAARWQGAGRVCWGTGSPLLDRDAVC
jgi:hypothetical protein